MSDATRTQPATCTLCEATCGILVDVEGDRVTGIRGDAADPQSRGYICPKATALADLHHDPDRLRTPLVREGGELRAASWDEALTRAGAGLRSVRHHHGRDAVGLYYGNPTAHNLGLLSYGLAFTRALRTRNLYSASTADQMPQMLVSERMYGHLGLVPVPDLDRTDHLLIVGANPLVSNGSLMTAPDMKRRLRAIRARGGRVVVIDPRRTETAEAADEHVFVRPGTDAFVLLAMLRVLFDEGLVELGRLAAMTDGVDAVERACRPFTPARVSPVTGVSPDAIARLARSFSGAARAAAYGRVGMCTQRHGSTSAWLVQVLNILTGRLDAEGGLMFTTPAIELLHVLAKVGMGQGYDRFRSRVRGLPENRGVSSRSPRSRRRSRSRALAKYARSSRSPATPRSPRRTGRAFERALGTLDFHGQRRRVPERDDEARARRLAARVAALQVALRPRVERVLGAQHREVRPARVPRRSDERHDGRSSPRSPRRSSRRAVSALTISRRALAGILSVGPARRSSRSASARGRAGSARRARPCRSPSCARLRTGSISARSSPSSRGSSSRRRSGSPSPPCSSWTNARASRRSSTALRLEGSTSSSWSDAARCGRTTAGSTTRRAW
ncbi:MAG: molybdopterin-dependent oxidoreductase [Polyangiaceae bacterium]